MCKLKKTAVMKKIVFLLFYSRLQFLSVQKHCGFIGWIYTRDELSKAEIKLGQFIHLRLNNLFVCQHVLTDKLGI